MMLFEHLPKPVVPIQEGSLWRDQDTRKDLKYSSRANHLHHTTKKIMINILQRQTAELPLTFNEMSQHLIPTRVVHPPHQYPAR